MVFWSIVLGIIAVMLLLSWRADRRSRGTGRFRRRNIHDSVGIQQGKSQMKSGSPWLGGR
jgi:hypothetical protein